MTPARYIFHKTFTGLTLLACSFIISEEHSFDSCVSDQHQPMEIPGSQNPAQQSRWKLTAANQSNFA